MTEFVVGIVLGFFVCFVLCARAWAKRPGVFVVSEEVDEGETLMIMLAASWGHAQKATDAASGIYLVGQIQHNTLLEPEKNWAQEIDL